MRSCSGLCSRCVSPADVLLVCLQSAISRCLEGHNDDRTMNTARVLAGIVGDDFDFLLRLSKCCTHSGCWCRGLLKRLRNLRGDPFNRSRSRSALALAYYPAGATTDTDVSCWICVNCSPPVLVSHCPNVSSWSCPTATALDAAVSARNMRSVQWLFPAKFETEEERTRVRL